MADGYGIDTITAELGAAVAAVESGQKHLATIPPYADSAKARMLQGGLRGVARGLDQIKDRAEQAHTQFGAAVPTIGQLATRAGSVSDDSAPQEVTTALKPLVEAIARCKSQLFAAAQAVNDLIGLINRNLAGGSPQYLLARATPAKKDLQTAAAHLDTAKTATDHTLNLAAQAGTGQGK